MYVPGLEVIPGCHTIPTLMRKDRRVAMSNSPRLLYTIEQEAGLCPILSECSRCAFVEYIYFVGVVCHAEVVRLDVDGRCQQYRSS